MQLVSIILSSMLWTFIVNALYRQNNWDYGTKFALLIGGGIVIGALHGIFLGRKQNPHE